MKTGNKIILGIIIAILLIGLGTWFNDFITLEKEIKNSPISYDGQPYIDDSYAIAEDTGKVTETPEKTTVTDSYSFSLSSGESKTVKSENTTITVTYGDKKKTNYLMSINGIKVNKYGEFDIAIDGISYHIKSVSLKCPNPDCRRHTFCADCNFQFTKDEKSHAECSVCHALYKYENSIDDFFFNCPECGDTDCTTFKSCNYCRHCGRNLADDKERLLNYPWESR
jgi:hypothetical protein